MDVADAFGAYRASEAPDIDVELENERERFEVATRQERLFTMQSMRREEMDELDTGWAEHCVACMRSWRFARIFWTKKMMEDIQARASSYASVQLEVLEDRTGSFFTTLHLELEGLENEAEDFLKGLESAILPQSRKLVADSVRRSTKRPRTRSTFRRVFRGR